jgi:hypothetical protein
VKSATSRSFEDDVLALVGPHAVSASATTPLRQIAADILAMSLLVLWPDRNAIRVPVRADPSAGGCWRARAATTALGVDVLTATRLFNS